MLCNVQCYKHVCALIDRQIRKVKPRQRLSAFFLISAICRHSLKKYKLQDKYSASADATCYQSSNQTPFATCFCCSQKMDTFHCRANRTITRHLCRAASRSLLISCHSTCLGIVHFDACYASAFHPQFTIQCAFNLARYSPLNQYQANCVFCFQAQVEKVLASWRKEKVFSEATISSCAASLGLSSQASGAALPAALPQPSEHMQQDGAAAVTIPALPSPANSLFSEPSAGSIDAAVLDAFPPKTVASANVEALSR